MNDLNPFVRPLPRDHVSGTRPLRPNHLRAPSPPDMASHVRSKTGRVLAVVMFIALCQLQLKLYVAYFTQ